MKRERNTMQMKEQIRNTEVQVNEEEIGKIMIVKIIKNLENEMEKMQLTINKMQYQLIKT